MIIDDPNKYVGPVVVWEEQKVKEIMQDIVNFTKQSGNNINWNKYDTRRKSKKI